MKKVLISFALIMIATKIEGSEITQISESWKVGDIVFTMQTEQFFDDRRVNAYKEICIKFHREDFFKSGGPEFYGYSKESFDSYAYKFLDLCADKFKKSEASLVLISKQEEIIGGTYFMIEEGGQTVCIYSIGYRFDIPHKELELAQINLIEALSSSKNFPNSKRLVVFLKKNSQNISLFFNLGFNNSDYTRLNTLHSPFSDINLLSYEKRITW